jgi:hypothetical protein
MLACLSSIFLPYGSWWQLYLFLKKATVHLLAITDPFVYLIIFFKLFYLVIHDHVSHYLKLKLSPSHHGFTKSKSIITNLVTYIDVITPLVGSQGQADAIYFDLSSDLSLVPHILLLHKLSTFGLKDGNANWFCSYLTNRQILVPVSGILSSPSVVLSGVSHGSVLGPLLFNIFINDLCNVINYSAYLLFAADIRIFRAIKSPNDCNRLQSDIDSVQGWCTGNFMKLSLRSNQQTDPHPPESGLDQVLCSAETGRAL